MQINIARLTQNATAPIGSRLAAGRGSQYRPCHPRPRARSPPPRSKRSGRARPRASDFRHAHDARLTPPATGAVRSPSASDETLDADDAFAQLVFHELCHAITEGEGAVASPDWGLDNSAGASSCASTPVSGSARTWRSASGCGRRWRRPPNIARYYDALAARSAGADAGSGDRDRRSRRAFGSTLRPGARPIEEALAATAVLAEPRHPLGFRLGSGRIRPAAAAPGSTSAGAERRWRAAGRAAPTLGDGARTEAGHRACARWEPPVDCQLCGACCREAYHSVTVSVRDPVVWKEPDADRPPGAPLRDSPRGRALRGAEGRRAATRAPRYACTIYDNRPNPCRDFAAGGRHCLDARRRVGLSVIARR